MKTLFFMMLACCLSGCSILQPNKLSWNSDLPEAELHGALNRVQEKLGMRHKGGRIRVRTLPGTHMSADRPWMGRPYDDGIHRGIATGIAWGDRNILLYTTDGRYRPATMDHEMAHAVLHSRRVPIDQHHAIMRRAGIF